ncbi:hypothetical protein H0H93_006914, partial [Arthromyces matolae]
TNDAPIEPTTEPENNAVTNAPPPREAELPADGSFERFLLDLQTDLRTALTSVAPADVEPTPPIPPTESAPTTTASTTEAASTTHDEEDSDFNDMPALAD